MSNETIMPVRHGIISGTATTAAEAGRSGFKGLLTGLAVGALGPIAVGIAVLGGAGLLFGGLTGLAVGAVLGTGLGAVGSAVLTTPAMGLGTIIGGFKGAARGVEKVSHERGAANMLDAQVSAYQAQANAAAQQPTIYAPSAANNNYATASTMNQAGTKIQADSAQDLGTVNGMQLQRA